MRLTLCLLLPVIFMLTAWALAEPTTHAREARALELLKEGRYEEAAPEFIWLWKQVVGPSESSTRVRIFVDQMKPLLQHSATASQAFGAVLADYRKRLEEGTLDDSATAIWAVWETQIGDPDRVATWWSLLTDPEDSYFDLSRPWVFELLVQREQWYQAGLVFPDPCAYADNLLKAYALMKETDPTLQEITDTWTATTFGNLYRALLAADRADVAHSLREFVLERNSAEIVEQAMRRLD